jgi:S-disulfanyl-L-cysteine oxidoreductase SoxD
MRNAHGNLAEQNRMVGPQHGADTTRAPGAAGSAAPAAPAPQAGGSASTQALARKLDCLTCHGIDHKLVGPGLREVGSKYAGRDDAADCLVMKILSGGSSVWGSIRMPPQSIPPADAKALAQWIASGAKP